jgi:glycosyltransferase involved in cell wall biosynthesis
MIKYSFIIPTQNINAYIRDLMPKIGAFLKDDFEVIIYPDTATEEKWPKARQILTGKLDPAGKRNLALRDAEGEILIFIDDDAYPENNFLEVLEKDFENPNIVAVGGPALTPAESNFWQKVSGAIFLSHLSGGFPERYRSIGKKKFVTDWPTVNLSIRKDTFRELGGFQCRYWPGEDTFLCYDLLTKKNLKVLYDPLLVVYHHRRESIIQHLHQISAYGLHRGYFVKKFTRTSLNWRYFMPSLLVLFIIIGAAVSFISRPFFMLYLFGWGVYLVAIGNAFYDIYKYERSFLVTLAASYYIFLTHIFYGLRFLQGLLVTRDLKSKLR